MPWKENSVSDQRIQFIALYLQDRMSLSELCRHFGISRPTGYKFIKRYLEDGPSGLRDKSRAPHTHQKAIEEPIQYQIIALRTKEPNRGPKKLKTLLENEYPGIVWPAASTIGDILKNNNLVKPRSKRRSSTPTLPCDLSKPVGPNSVWSADYKGQFNLGNGQMCYPLTICDGFSRMLLRCQGLTSTSFEAAKPVWVAAFREYGLPAVIRTDNGAPFAGIGIGGISRLSAWWIRLGIMPERIQPGKPQQNGSHERMHRTLKEETLIQPALNMKSQQQAFNAFVHDYNHIRPHEALGQKVPSSLYSVSTRPYPLVLPDLEYPSTITVRHVRTNGEIRWKGAMVFVSEVLAGENIGLEQLDDRHWALYYSRIPLAIFDDHKKHFLSAKEALPKLRQLRKELQADI